MTEHAVLVGYRLRFCTLAEELGDVSRACRLVGVHRSSYYRLKKRVVEWTRFRGHLRAFAVRPRKGRVRPEPDLPTFRSSAARRSSCCASVGAGWKLTPSKPRVLRDSLAERSTFDPAMTARAARRVSCQRAAQQTLRNWRR
jgi:hypothetical protein